MTKKKVRVKAAFLANAMIIVFAVLVVLPGISSFVSFSVPEVAIPFAAEPVWEPVSPDPVEPEPENPVRDQVLAAIDESLPVTAPVPETNYFGTSLTGFTISSEETVPEENAIRSYLTEKAETERQIREALEREKKMFEYDPAYLATITLSSDTLYECDYRPDEIEFRMLAYVVQHEAGPSLFMQEVLVCEAIFNRVFSPRFPNDLISVLTASRQYSGFNGYYEAVDYVPSETVKNAIAYVLSGDAPDLVGGGVYFCNPNISAHMDWFNTLELTLEIPNYRFYK